MAGRSSSAKSGRRVDDIGLEGMLTRTRALVDHVRRLERERCAERLRAMANEFPSTIALALRLAAERLVGG